MRGMNQIPASEITPLSVYLNRRSFMKVGLAAASVVTTGWVYRRLNPAGSAEVNTPSLAGLRASSNGPADIASGFRVDEPMTPLRTVSNYNNFYEFSTNKESVASAAAGFVSKPWQVAVGGMVHKPRVFDLDELLTSMPLEERVYRMRCVEGWSMVIPWSGFPLAKLLERVEPMGGVEYRRFRDAARPHTHARPDGGRPSLAVRRGSADGRSDAPADPPGGRPVRARAARPERCAAPAGGAVEIRLQGNQVDREDHAAVDAAADDLEHGCTERVRVLLQR